MRFRSFLHLSLLLVVTSLLTGCDPILRFYGSHGNVEAHHVQIRQAVEQFEATLAHNRADLQRLTAGAAENPALAPSAEAMAALVGLQEAVVAAQRARLDELAGEDDYRNLNHAYGAIITEQQMIADRYAEIAQRLQSDSTATSYMESVESASRYAFVPPQYYRTNNRMKAPSLDFPEAAARTAAGAGDAMMQPEQAGQ